jgi:methionyl-tRNA formyltransferase
MNIVFLTTDSVPAKFIATHLHQGGFLNTIIIEKNTAKTKAKILKEIKSSSWKKVPIKILDFLAIYIYSKMAKSYLNKHLLIPNQIFGFPSEITRHQVENASSPQCLSILDSLAPDILIVLGTSILKPEVLSFAKYHNLNIHGGIVPQYRNVHSDFWAASKGDFENIGTSIIHLDPGVDTGNIALQGSVKIIPEDTLFSIKNKNIELSLRLIIQAIELAKTESLPNLPQLKIKGGFHKTPGVFDFFRWFTTTSKSVKDFSCKKI